MFLYTSNEQSEKEIRKGIPLTVTAEIIKSLALYLTREMKDLNHETLFKETEADMRTGKNPVLVDRKTTLRC